MSVDVEKLHEKISKMSLSDVLFLAYQASISPEISKEKLELILRYVEISISKSRMSVRF